MTVSLVRISGRSFGVYASTVEDVATCELTSAWLSIELCSEPDARHAADMTALRALADAAEISGVPVSETAWIVRERDRMLSGEYKPLPDAVKNCLVFPDNHFVHLPNKEGVSVDSIAYTESQDKGLRDRQTIVKFGRYLKKYFPDMSDAEIQRHVLSLKGETAECELKFASDVETINAIFETPLCAEGGTSKSCMHGKFARRDVRPYHVYADSPDVAVAYLRDDSGILARAVCYVAEKLFVRSYALSHRDDLGTVLQTPESELQPRKVARIHRGRLWAKWRRSERRQEMNHCIQCGRECTGEVCCDDKNVDTIFGPVSESPVCKACCYHPINARWEGKSVAGGSFERCDI
jgi:hypothetical protein